MIFLPARCRSADAEWQIVITGVRRGGGEGGVFHANDRMCPTWRGTLGNFGVWVRVLRSRDMRMSLLSLGGLLFGGRFRVPPAGASCFGRALGSTGNCESEIRRCGFVFALLLLPGGA